jgi:hypothetical protein
MTLRAGPRQLPVGSLGVSPEMTFENRGAVAALKSPTAARQAVTGHNVRYVLGFSIAGVIVAFLIIATYMGQSLPVSAP